MKKHIIYKRTFPNGKVYIGQTCQNLQKYTRNVDSQAFTPSGKVDNRPYYNAIRKYKDKGIHTEVLYSNIDSDCIDDLETLIISTYDSTNRQYGYNHLSQGSSLKNYKHTEDSKIKMRDAKIGKKQSKQHIQKCALTRIGNIPHNRQQIPEYAFDFETCSMKKVEPKKFGKYSKGFNIEIMNNKQWQYWCNRLYVRDRYNNLKGK